MMSDGGLCPVQEFQGFKAVLSGPAGGVVGYASTTFGNGGNKKPVIGFDMVREQERELSGGSFIIGM